MTASAAGAGASGAGASGAVKVLLADDQDLVRAGFRMIVSAEDDLEVCGEAATGAEAIRAVDATGPDVVLMDVQMPGMDGLEATRRLTDARHGRRAKVIILTTFERDDYLFAALQAGASGFLLKNAPPEQLVEAVRLVAEGDCLLDPKVTRRVIEAFASAPVRSPDDARALEGLSAREREVLRLVATGSTNAEIAAELFIGEATVKTHVSHVLTKLGLRDRVQAVIFAYEAGVVRPGW